MEPTPLTPKELVEFSREHLYYEIDMLYGVARLLQKGSSNIYIYNALLESFVVHGSVILDFFYKLPLNPQEAKATHYIKDLEEWKDAKPPFDRYFIKFNKKRNQEVMHLSYARLKVAPYDKKWDSPKLIEQFRQLIDLFLDYADPALIHPRLYRFKRQKAGPGTGK